MDEVQVKTVLLVTGCRRWTNERAMLVKLVELTQRCSELTIVHGGARGADAMASRLGKKVNADVLVVPADWDRDGRSAGFKRNDRMLEMVLAMQDDGVNVEVMAFKEEFDSTLKRGGTEHMVKRCKEVGLHGVVVRR